MEAILTNGEMIDYQRDPSTQSQVNLQQMFTKLEFYNEVNKTKKTLLKKSKKLLNKYDVQKQKQKEAQNISDILKKVRKNNIIQEFVNKLKMNITLRNLKTEDQNQYFSIGKTSLQEDFRRKIRQSKIHKVLQNQTFDIITIVIKFFVITGIFYINTLKLAFDQLKSLDSILNGLIIVSISFFMIELGGMLDKINKNHISFWKNFFYWVEKQQFIWSLIMNFGLLLSLTNFPYVVPIIIIVITPQFLTHKNKLKKVENRFVLSINFERYWQLFKIVLFNFCIAHILSIVLNIMGSISVQDNENWYIQKNIKASDDWAIKYIWGYYWGTNIMLTVGFGDISAQNHVQAMILVFIETIACMIMAYNISEVSRILQNISLMDQQRKFKFKVFNQMSQKYLFQDQFKTNIINHIDKSIEIKHQLNYIEENLIQQLPQKIKLQVKRQVNKNVFLSAYFFKNLTKKTQNLLAQKVNKIFAHPEEIILKNMETWKIFILRQGSVAVTYKKGMSVNNGTIIQQYSVDQIKKPELLSLKFIRKIPIRGDLKSLDFSILNMLEINQFENILKEHDLPMFEYYCSEKDKTQYHQFDLQIRKCCICSNSKHDKFQCPRMHFIPLREHVIHKKTLFSHGQKVARNKVLFQRKKIKQSQFKIYHDTAKDDVFFRKNLKPFTDMIISSFQGIGPTPTENFDMGKKLDKCLMKLDQGLKIMKGVVDSQQLEVDAAYNYRRYFPQNNAQNLMFSLKDPMKRSKKIASQKKLNYVIL